MNNIKIGIASDHRGFTAKEFLKEYFDENDIQIRYGGEPDHQVAIKNIVNKIDPTLNIYYNFNEKSVANIHASMEKKLGAEHMLSILLKQHS